VTIGHGVTGIGGEVFNIDLWVKMGAIDFDKAKEMAKPHIKAINKKSREIAKKHGNQLSPASPAPPYCLK